MPLEKLWPLKPTLEHHWMDCNNSHTPMRILLSRLASMPVWNDRVVVHQAASGEVSVNSAFTWGLLLCNAYQFYSSNLWVLRHHSVHALDMSTIKVFVYLGLQFKWNQLSSNNARHTNCIHERLHAGNWPDRMASKSDALSTLGTTGQTTLEPNWHIVSPSGFPVTIQCYFA